MLCSQSYKDYLLHIVAVTSKGLKSISGQNLEALIQKVVKTKWPLILKSKFFRRANLKNSI